MRASRGSAPAARRLVSLVLFSCALVNGFVWPGASSCATGNVNRTGKGCGRTSTTTPSALRSVSADVVTEDMVLAKFKRLQVSCLRPLVLKISLFALRVMTEERRTRGVGHRKADPSQTRKYRGERRKQSKVVHVGR